MEYSSNSEVRSDWNEVQYDDFRSLVEEHNLTKLRDKDLNQMSPDNRKRLVRNEIRKIVQILGREGITVSEINQLTDVSDTTIRNHLEALRNLREVSKEKRNDQLHLYYPNATPLMGIGPRRIEDGDSVLEVKPAKDRFGRHHLHILEKSRSLMDGERSEGAITVPVEKLDEMFDVLNEVSQELENQ